MERHVLDSLYRGSRGNASRAFRRAASETPVGSDAYGFLVDHAAELDVEVLLQLLGSELAFDVVSRPKPFLERLAELLPSAGVGSVLRVLQLHEKVPPEAWIEDLTLPLRGRLPAFQWYRFIDKARGGPLFNALNLGTPTDPNCARWDPDRSFVTSIEESRPEPVVVGLLERAHDDLAVAQYALDTQTPGTLLGLHAAFPSLVSAAAIQELLPKRVAARKDSWLPPGGIEQLPEWMGPFVVERLRYCDDDEARTLYEWLFSSPRGDLASDPFDLAVLRFELVVRDMTPGDWTHWCPLIARHLTTGSSWKSRGRKFIARCIELNKGFPPQVLEVALDSVRANDGATTESHQRAILRRVHDETAGLLIEFAKRALPDSEQADLYLSAFLSLDAGSFVSGALHRLGKLPGLSPELLARVNACRSLTHAGGRTPTKEAFLEAFLVLTRQLP